MMIDRSQPPALRQFGEVKLTFPRRQVFTNGIQYWAVTGAATDINRLSIYVRGGSLHEHKPMLAALTALLLLEGSRERNAQQIAERLDHYGAWKTAQCHDTHTEVGLSSLNSNYDSTLPIVMDCIENPTFPASQLEVLKRRYAATCAMQRERVKVLAEDEMRRLYYGDGHPLARTITPEGIMNVTLDDVKSFYRRYYSPANCSAVLSGNVGHDILRVTDRCLGGWKRDGIADKDVDWRPKPSSQMLSVVHKPGAVQAAVVMTLPAVLRSHPDYLALRFAVTLLGGYFGSRLNRNIREQKGLTYGIQSYLAGMVHDAHIAISTECAPQYVKQVIAEVRHEMRRLCQEPASAAEMETVRQHMISDMVKTLDTPFTLASYVSSTLLYGVYAEYFNDQMATVLSMTTERLIEVAQKYLRPDDLRIVVAGDEQLL